MTPDALNEQEGKELGARCLERARKAQPALDRLEIAWQRAGCPACSTERDEAITVHKELARGVMGDVVKTCIRVLVRSALRQVIEEKERRS